MKTGARNLARSSSSARQAARRWRSTSSPSAAGRCPAGGTRALAFAASIAFLATRSPLLGEEVLITPEFHRAAKLLEEPSTEKRAEGERLIRAMGQRAVPQLQAWIARAEGDLDRFRSLLADLGGPKAEPDEPLLAARALFSRELAGAWTQFHRGEYGEAKRTAEAILRLDPESPELWQIRRLARQCEDRLISKELLTPTLEFRELVYGIDDRPRILFRLVNRTRSAVSVRAERGILGQLKVDYERRFLDGSARADGRTTPIRSSGNEEEIDLAPGASYEREFPLTIEGPLPERGMALRIRAVGKFQPSQWGIEDRNLSRTLSLPATECWVVAPGEKPLAHVPVKKLESAIFFRDLHSFFTAGHLAVWAAEDDPLLNEKLLKILVESLKELDPTGIRVADGLLEAASGVRRDSKAGSADEIAEFWRRFWADRRQGGKRKAETTPALLPKFLDRSRE